MVPESWDIHKLGDLISHIKGFAFKSKSYAPSGVRVIRISDTTRNSVKPYGAVYINEKEAKNLKKYELNANDLILTTVGSRPHMLDSMVGKLVRIPKVEAGALLNQNMVKLAPKKAMVEPDYLYEALKNDRFIYFISTLVRGNANQVSISLKEFFSYKIPVPPLPEQKKIAQILSTWDKAITTTEKLLKNSQQQKKALMQQLLTGKKRLKGFSGEFKRFHFSQLLEIDKQNLGSKTKPDFAFDYISLSDVSPGVISRSLEKYSFRDAPSRARRIVQDGDILLATVRPNLQGFARVRKINDGAIASTGFAVLTPKSNIYGDYVYHYLFGAHITGQINALVVGTNYPAINSSDVAGLCIYCPCYEEQKEIAQVLNNCDSTTQSLNNKLEKLKQEKKALMRQLLTGKKRVKLQ